jgi:pimeloyl-ACP methyl ester carboxylesterase
MSNQRTHYVTTSDGVTIGGTVHGQGPSLVFLHGVIGDGDLDWQAVLPHLSGRFTCHLPSWRGRGLSDDHPDLSPGRRVDDVLGYVDSIGAPTGLVGWSGGADTALAAAALSGAVTAVVPVEPVLPPLMDAHEQAALADAVASMAQLAAAGRLTDASRAFAAFPFTDGDIAAAEHAGYFEATGRYVWNLLHAVQQVSAHEGPSPHDPAVLGAIAARVLVLRGSDTKPYAIAAARHVANHVRSARMQQIPGAGHAIPLTHPEALAAAITGFFSPAQQPA